MLVCKCHTPVNHPDRQEASTHAAVIWDLQGTHVFYAALGAEAGMLLGPSVEQRSKGHSLAVPGKLRVVKPPGKNCKGESWIQIGMV
jgi:hypothetical protein